MKLKRAISIGKECGLSNINECIRNIEIHSSMLFRYIDIDEALNELDYDIEQVAIQYGTSAEEVLKWKISEYELYAK